MAADGIVLSRGSFQNKSNIVARAEKPVHKAPGIGQRTKSRRTAPKAARPKKAAAQSALGSLPILYMLSPQKFMSPFDCNIAADSGYKIVLPYENVTTADIESLIQDAIFSRPPGARTGVFIGGKNIRLAIEMMSAARKAMVAPFDVSLFADPGGSYTTAAAMVACVERVLKRHLRRGLKGQRISVFGATGVVGFASAVIAAREGGNVKIVAHDKLEPLLQSAALAKEHFGANLVAVEGQTEAAKAKVLGNSDIVFTCGPPSVNIIPRQLIARAPNLLVAADVNAVQPYGVEGIELYMDGVPLPGCSTLGVGALAIGDVKYKTQAGLYKQMLAAKTALALDFRDAFVLARELTAEAPRRKGGRSKTRS